MRGLLSRADLGFQGGRNAGCWERAHRICAFAEARGWRSGKIWAIGPKRLRTGSGLLEPDFRDSPDPARRLWGASWHIHVAPTLLVGLRVDGGEERAATPLAIDPLLFAEPVRLARWFAQMRRPDALMVQSGPECFMLRALAPGPSFAIIDRVESDDYHSKTTVVLGSVFKRTA